MEAQNKQPWVCPQCHKSKAPWIEECDCKGAVMRIDYPFAPTEPFITDDGWTQIPTVFPIWQVDYDRLPTYTIT